MSKIKASVILIARKEEELASVIEDLKNQTIQDFEIINVVGNMRIPKAWNEGVKKAIGEIILFTESDVRLPRDWVEKMVKLVEKKDFVMGSEVIVTSIAWSMSNVGIKAKIAREIPFDESFRVGDDTDWFERIRQRGFKIEREKEPVVYHYKSTDPKKLLKRELVSGVDKARIWLKHEDPELNLKRILLGRVFFIARETIQLFGIVYGLIRYFHLIPRKILMYFKRWITKFRRNDKED